MKYYKAVIESNGEWAADEANSALLRMELIFTVGDRVGETAGGIVGNVLKDLHISRYTKVVKITGISENLAYGEMSEPPELVLGNGECPLHRGVVHKDGVMVLDQILYPNHEYQITTKTSLQRNPRNWRMGYIGRQGGSDLYLQFSARGPDRSHRHPYAGTQMLDIRDIIALKEVERDDAKRYVPRR